MRKKVPKPLPEPLQYLRPFVQFLAKLLPEELNEDVDDSRLEALLRKRVRGLGAKAAAAAISRDRDELEHWLKTSASRDHPAFWILGYLSLPKLGEYLTRPAEPPRRGPEISFDAPPAWKVKVVPFGLYLKKGKLVGAVTVIDQISFDLLQKQLKHWKAPPGLKARWEQMNVRYGRAAGAKYVFKQTAPASWKRVNYFLKVPGGYVSVMLDAMGADFDETAFEAQLHTLRLSKPPPS